ncbi:MAG TPA: YciI family protein [Gammaproteobacteria bacterium]|nr:YciI family protein [Gammaproteobacteria bacterium]
MRFMIVVKSAPASRARAAPGDVLLGTFADYRDALAKAGVLLDGSALEPSSAGSRVVFDGEKRRVVEGAPDESKEVIAGYALIQVKTREEALEWARRFPSPAAAGGNAEIEVLEIVEPRLAID